MGSKKRIIQYAYLLEKVGALSEHQKEQLIHQITQGQPNKK